MKLLLVDGSAVLHRAYHAYPSLTTRDGQVVGTVYGVASILISALQETRPTEVAVAWDLPQPTFRHALYIGYKAKRQKADQEMVEQIPLTKQVIEAMGLKQIERAGYEADDIIGSLASQAADKHPVNSKQQLGDVEVVILTGDQDTMQLVTEQVHILMPPRGREPAKEYGRAEVIARYGVRPDQIVDYKALVGDASDNIPGVAGVGPKGAAELLNQYGSLENIFANLAKIPDKIRGKLEQGRESAYLSQELARIVVDMQLDISKESLAYTGLEREELREMLTRLGFRSLLRRLWPESLEPKHKKIPDNQMGLF